jgi:hypothetical protein
MCNSKIYAASSYSSDGFHPNDVGYSGLADVVYPAVASGTTSGPNPSCAQMTVF